jgi:TPR repeat protein
MDSMGYNENKKMKIQKMIKRVKYIVTFTAVFGVSNLLVAQSPDIVQLKKEAEQGYADAQVSLGDCYRNGEGVTQDYKQAVYWFRKATEQGYTKAQSALKQLF